MSQDSTQFVNHWLNEILGPLPLDEQLDLWHDSHYPFTPEGIGSGSIGSVGHTELCGGAELSRDCERTPCMGTERAERASSGGAAERRGMAVQQETTD